ncbi:MAG: flagellar biosynthesis protein FlgD [Nitrospirae bacterium]|nr:flagellar biosynthesis protein FlgD [Nitrospirota bacterium]
MIVKTEQNDIRTIRKESEKRLSPSKLPPPLKKKLGMEDYMNIMIRQLQYQDPFHPMDNRKFASQLAQFSQLDQLVHLNKKMEGMASQGKESDSLQMVGFLGREVFLKGNRFIKNPHESASLVFRLDRPAEKSTVYIYGAKHQLIRTLKAGPMEAGNQHVAWDGLSNRGTRAPEGGYEFEVVARDARNRPVSASPLRTGIVTGVVFSGTRPRLEVNGEKVDLSDITHVGIVRGEDTSLRPAPAPNLVSGPRPAPYAKTAAKSSPTIHHTL